MRVAVYASASFACLLLSFFISLNQAVINTDGICYLTSAYEVGQAGIHAAMQLCGQAAWPFYSILIALVTRFSHLSFVHAAYLIDALATLVTVLSFIKIVEMLGGKGRVLWLATFVILSAHQFNSVRQYIVRDHGFWAFYLVSFIFYLQFLRHNTLVNALGFSASLIMATLFRIEGAVFLALLPIVTLFFRDTWQERGSDFIKLNLLTVVGLVCAWLFLQHGAAVEKTSRLPDLMHHVTQGYQIIITKFLAAKSRMEQFVLPMEAARDAGLIWMVTLLVMYCVHIINHCSWAATALLIYAWLNGVTAKFSRTARFALYAFIVVNIAVTSLFFVERLFFAKRYLIALSLILFLWLPFALEQLIASGYKKRFAAYFAMLVLFASTLGTITDNGHSKFYIRDAGNWLATHVPANTPLYTNDILIAYYSNHFGNHIFTKMQDYKTFQPAPYMAIRVGKHQADHLLTTIKQSSAVPVEVFKNNHGDQIIIYQAVEKVS